MFDKIILYTTPRLRGTGSTGHDLKFDSLRMSVAFKIMIILQNLRASNLRYYMSLNTIAN